MSHLVVQVAFIAHSYSGVRIGPDRREVLDWPPSPARLHEALLSAALIGLPRPSDEREKIWSAFRWLESLQPPVILASAQDGKLRSAPRLAIPQNNPNKSKFNEHSTLLAPAIKAVPPTSASLEVVYQWDIESNVPDEHIEILKDAAARISYLGRGEDRAEVSLGIVREPESKALVRWQPDSGGDTNLWVPKVGTTNGLEERHTAKVAEREARKPAQRWMRLVRYSDDSPRAMQPIAIAIFQLFPENGDPDARPLSCDPECSGLWREFFRSQIVALAKDTGNWDEPPLADELLTGHCFPERPALRPHLAIVPLPSIDAARKADGRVRRVALIGYAAPNLGIGLKALSIYNTVFTFLDNLVVAEQTPRSRWGKSIPVRISQCQPNADPIWYHITEKSRVWCTTTPVAISRNFKVPKFHPDGRSMSDNERYRRRLRELADLIRGSMRHIGVPPELIAACSIQTTAAPLIPKSQRAERYRPPGEKAFLTHVRLDFPVQVRGPLILGDRRYFGLGLFVPVNT
ncbi:MAG TPA: type I-U CRISPR-associated protein Csb2 [Candidatus Sulfotelmatobacter sp.]|nr:type I-U CRISPR-associated protein Csb2 [Candidatus Sulfotelmatobacter sp.]